MAKKSKTGYDGLKVHLEEKGISESQYYSELAKKSWQNRGKKKATKEK